MFFLKEVIDALCNGYGSEIVQGNDQFQIAAGTGDTGIADHAVQTFGMQLMQLVYSGLSSFRGCQVHADIAVLQIDIDAAEINKNVQVDACVTGDLKMVLKQILEKQEKMDHSQWVAHIMEMKEKYPLNYDHTQLTGPYVIQKLYELTGGDAIISTDVGQHQMWAAQYFKFKEPRTFLTSGGLGTMGYGLGAAIGARMGCPDKTVVNIAGDGCFRMNMNEIATAVRCKKPLVQIVLNNHVLGMVRQWQTLFYGQRYSQTILDDAVDFVKLSEAMGAKAIRVTRTEEVEPALKEALSSKGTVVLDCWIDQNLSVYPMVPAGASLDDVFDEEDMKENEQSI